MKNMTGQTRRAGRALRRNGVLLALLVSGLAAVGVAYAAFSASGTAAENEFTIQAGEAGGKIPNDEENGTGVVEEHWSKTDDDKDGVPDAAQDLQPGSTVSKDPCFVSPLSYDAWVALKLEIPVASFRKGAETQDSVQDCVTIENLDTTGWEKLYQKVSTTDGTHSVYYYGYKTVVAGKPAGKTQGGKTSSLFTAIKVPDITSLSLKSDGNGFSGKVNVTPYAVQAEGYETIEDAREMLLQLAGLNS